MKPAAAQLGVFFLPYVLPVSVVFRLWNWVFETQYGVLQYPIEAIFGHRISIFRTQWLFMPGVALVTIWWTSGFSILLFIAGLRNIPQDVYEAASLDNAGRWRTVVRITWPLLWPITTLVFSIQVIAQLKVFDQVYLFGFSGPTDPNMGLVQYVFRQAFQQNKGGYGATIALTLFVIVVAASALQLVAARARSER